MAERMALTTFQQGTQNTADNRTGNQYHTNQNIVDLAFKVMLRMHRDTVRIIIVENE